MRFTMPNSNETDDRGRPGMFDKAAVAVVIGTEDGPTP